MEAYFAAEYGYDVRDIFRMSWRRFRTLLKRGFTLIEKDQLETAIAEMPGTVPNDDLYEGFDWNKALDDVIGRKAPQHKIRMSPDEFKQMVK